MSVTGPTRELACLALLHDDTGEVRCPATDEQLMRQLVAEVQRLRVAAGEVAETAVDRAVVEGALAEALAGVWERWDDDGYAPEGIEAWAPRTAADMLPALAEDGWQLTRRRP